MQTFLSACGRKELSLSGERRWGGPLSSVLVLMGRRLPGVPGGSGSAWSCARCYQGGTVNPLNGLGGNSSSPPLNGSSEATRGALEVAELRPYSGPNHPRPPPKIIIIPLTFWQPAGHRQPLCLAVQGTLCWCSSNVPLCVPRAGRGQ